MHAEALRLISLGRVYAEDGAEITAAQCLREAARLLEEVHAEKSRALFGGGKAP